MSFLKQIPCEEESCNKGPRRGRSSFNPAQKLKKHSCEAQHGFSLKEVCVDLVHFINCGEKYTLEHVEKVITQLQRSVIQMQKKKTDILKTKNEKIKLRKKK